jgi:hypothetical protein
MSTPENNRIRELCSQISVEQNRERFQELIEELNRALGTAGEPLRAQQKKTESDR